MKLNKIEKLKQEFVPYDFYSRLPTLEWNNLSEADRFYLKNYGIYNIKLRPENFMIRVRIGGGRISLMHLKVIVDTALKYDLDIVVTARAQLELHGLSAQNVWEVWTHLDKFKIITLQTLTDNFRNIITDVYDGLRFESRVEVYPLIVQMQTIFLAKKEWMGMLPRKFNTAICGSEVSHMHFFGNDLFFALAKKEEIWGFNVYVGGKNSASAQCVDIFVLPEQVPAMFEAVAKAYSVYGSRASRSKTRLYHLISEIGVAGFRAKIAEFFTDDLVSKGCYAIKKSSPSKVTMLKDGTKGVCIFSHFGKVDKSTLSQMIDMVNENAAVRVGIDQNFYLCGLREEPFFETFEKVEGACEITACAGSRYCALSLWDIKEETAYLPLEMIAKYHIQIGFSGCLKGCGRHHHCDIGLVGLRTNLFGEVQKAARVFLGGVYSREDARPARLLYYVVPLVHLEALLKVIIEEFLVSGCNDFETFSRETLSGYSDSFLTMWFLAKLYLSEKITLSDTQERLYCRLLGIKSFPSYPDDIGYEETIRFLMHQLWD